MSKFIEHSNTITQDMWKAIAKARIYGEEGGTKVSMHMLQYSLDQLKD